MDQEFEKRRKQNVDWEALGMKMPELKEETTTPQSENPLIERDSEGRLTEESKEQLRLSFFAFLKEETAKMPVYLPDSSGPPVDEEARKLLLAYERRELSREQEEKVRLLTERYKGWEDARHEIFIAERTRKRREGLTHPFDQLLCSRSGDFPRTFAEEVELCKQAGKRMGKDPKYLAELVWRLDPRLPEVLKLLSEENKDH